MAEKNPWYSLKRISAKHASIDRRRMDDGAIWWVRI